MKTVYLAGPISGLTFDDCTDWRETASRWLADYGAIGLSPMRGKAFLRKEDKIGDSYEGTAIASQKGITTRDRNDVMTCDAILVNLLGAEKVSIGTMIELGWADAWRKPVVLVMDPNSLHDHAMVREIAGYIAPTLEAAIAILRTVLGC